MKLDSHQPELSLRHPSSTLSWLNESYKNQSPSELQASTWVHLLELPSPFSYDEALLLCQCSEDEWIAWIPDHGEAVLNVRQFYPVS